jgi:hypothetical protein
MWHGWTAIPTSAASRQLLVDLPPVPDLDELDPHRAFGQPLDRLGELGRPRELWDLLVLQRQDDRLRRCFTARLVARAAAARGGRDERGRHENQSGSTQHATIVTQQPKHSSGLLPPTTVRVSVNGIGSPVKTLALKMPPPRGVMPGAVVVS